MKTLDYIEIVDEASLTGICAANMNTAAMLASAIAKARFNCCSIPFAHQKQMHDSFVTIAVASKAMEQLIRIKGDISHTEGLQSKRISDMLDPVIYATNEEIKREEATLKINIEAITSAVCRAFN